MATIKTRVRADGVPSYREVWRAGGTRQSVWESETFVRRTDAARFCRDVDLAGQLWPEGWVKGVGYERADPAAEVPVVRYRLARWTRSSLQ